MSMGDNIAPYAEGVAERLELDYAELMRNAAAAIEDTEALPQVIETSADVEPIASAMKKLRDIGARAEAHRKAEKEPYLRAGDAVYAFFTKRLVEPIGIRYKQLNARLDAFKQLQLAEERARREAEAAIARKQQAEAQRLRDEAEAAARRARSAETVEFRAAEASRARIELDMAVARAEQKALATMASSSAMVRERFEGERSGHVGMRKTPLVMIEDVRKLDLELLRPHFKEEHLLLALKGWARSTGYQQEMPGAIVAMRDATVVR
jgi:hypothetical protein